MNKIILFIFLVLIILTNCNNIKENRTEETSTELTDQENYFLDISLNMEFESGEPVIKKWNIDKINIFVKDSTNTALMKELRIIIKEINALSKSTTLKIVSSIDESNFVIFFSDQDTYASYEPRVVPYLDGNWGLFRVDWDSEFQIYRGNMYVDTKRNTDINCMKHLLREELTQSLGLLNDTNAYPGSIFYQGWECNPSYLEIDKKLITYILDPKIKAGMSKDEVIPILRKIK